MCRDRHYIQVKQAASYVWNVDIAGLFTDATDNTQKVFLFGNRSFGEFQS